MPKLLDRFLEQLPTLNFHAIEQASVNQWKSGNHSVHEHEDGTYMGDLSSCTTRKLTLRNTENVNSENLGSLTRA